MSKVEQFRMFPPWSNKQKPPAPKMEQTSENVFHSFGGNISHISMYLTYSALKCGLHSDRLAGIFTRFHALRKTRRRDMTYLTMDRL